MVIFSFASAEQQKYRQEVKRLTSSFQSDLLNRIDDYFIEIRRKKMEEKKELMGLIDAGLLGLQNSGDSEESKQRFQKGINFYMKYKDLFDIPIEEF